MKLEFIIHDLNRYGGQERSTFEIIESLLPEHRVRVLASSTNGLAAEVEVLQIPVFRRRPLLIKDFVFRIRASLLPRERADLRHATGCCVFSADVFTIQFLHRRWLKELGGLGHTPLLPRLKDWLQALHDAFWERIVISLNRDRHFVAISTQVAEDLRHYYGLRNVHLIPHAVNTREFRPAEEREVPSSFPELQGKKLLLFAGTYERKGLATLIRALALLESGDCHLLIVGDGPRHRMELLARRHDVEGRIHFIGATKEIAPFYRMADLFILPSHYDPYGLVGIEALASGCPAILSRNSGCSELIREGENGYVLKNAGDAAELARLIDRFFLASEKNPETTARRRTAARASVAGCDWADRRAPYGELFSSLAGSS